MKKVCLYHFNSYFILLSIFVNLSIILSSAVDRRFEPRSGQTKDYKFGICCFSTKYAALRRKSKDWLDRNQNNVSEWRDMSAHRLLFR